MGLQAIGEVRKDVCGCNEGQTWISRNRKLARCQIAHLPPPLPPTHGCLTGEGPTQVASLLTEEGAIAAPHHRAL